MLIQAGLFNTFGRLGGFFGPTLLGVLKQGSGDYATGMVAVAFGYALTVLIVIAVGRAVAPRPALVAAKTPGAT
jgi:MFS-type transporter involved in bile tolerance (Atg22 family)